MLIRMMNDSLVHGGKHIVNVLVLVHMFPLNSML